MQNNNTNGVWLNHTLFKLALSIILLATGAWAKWVTTSIFEINDIKTDIAIIRKDIDDLHKDFHAQRHNP